MFKTLSICFGSISAMEIANLTANGFNLASILFQVIIFLLTVRKLYLDIKLHKFKSLDDTIQKQEKKHPFITAVYNLLKRNKNEPPNDQNTLYNG